MVDVIAPDSNRSATARSITTRSPLTVEEVDFGDGDCGYATDGTPVDCVRFAELGLVGERPDLIVSGINHGANLGDDITYSGTVAAALRASCSAFRRSRSLNSPRPAAWATSAVTLSSVSPPLFAAQLVAPPGHRGDARRDLINVNLPRRRADRH